MEVFFNELSIKNKSCINYIAKERNAHVLQND